MFDSTFKVFLNIRVFFRVVLLVILGRLTEFAEGTDALELGGRSEVEGYAQRSLADRDEVSRVGELACWWSSRE